MQNKKEQNTGTRYNMDAPQKRYAEWKKMDIEGYTLYDSIYTKCPEKANSEYCIELQQTDWSEL